MSSLGRGLLRTRSGLPLHTSQTLCSTTIPLFSPLYSSTVESGLGLPRVEEYHTWSAHKLFANSISAIANPLSAFSAPSPLSFVPVRAMSTDAGTSEPKFPPRRTLVRSATTLFDLAEGGEASSEADFKHRRHVHCSGLNYEQLITDLDLDADFFKNVHSAHDYGVIMRANLNHIDKSFYSPKRTMAIDTQSSRATILQILTGPRHNGAPASYNPFSNTATEALEFVYQPFDQFSVRFCKRPGLASASPYQQDRGEDTCSAGTQPHRNIFAEVDIDDMSTSTEPPILDNGVMALRGRKQPPYSLPQNDLLDNLYGNTSNTEVESSHLIRRRRAAEASGETLDLQLSFTSLLARRAMWLGRVLAQPLSLAHQEYMLSERLEDLIARLLAAGQVDQAIRLFNESRIAYKVIPGVRTYCEILAATKDSNRLPVLSEYGYTFLPQMVYNAFRNDDNVNVLAQHRKEDLVENFSAPTVFDKTVFDKRRLPPVPSSDLFMHPIQDIPKSILNTCVAESAGFKSLSSRERAALVDCLHTHTTATVGVGGRLTYSVPSLGKDTICPTQWLTPASLAPFESVQAILTALANASPPHDVAFVRQKRKALAEKASNEQAQQREADGAHAAAAVEAVTGMEGLKTSTPASTSISTPASYAFASMADASPPLELRPDAKRGIGVYMEKTWDPLTAGVALSMGGKYSVTTRATEHVDGTAVSTEEQWTVRNPDLPVIPSLSALIDECIRGISTPLVRTELYWDNEDKDYMREHQQRRWQRKEAWLLAREAAVARGEEVDPNEVWTDTDPVDRLGKLKMAIYVFRPDTMDISAPATTVNVGAEEGMVVSTAPWGSVYSDIDVERCRTDIAYAAQALAPAFMDVETDPRYSYTGYERDVLVFSQQGKNANAPAVSLHPTVEAVARAKHYTIPLEASVSQSLQYDWSARQHAHLVELSQRTHADAPYPPIAAGGGLYIEAPHAPQFPSPPFLAPADVSKLSAWQPLLRYRWLALAYEYYRYQFVLQCRADVSQYLAVVARELDCEPMPVRALIIDRPYATLASLQQSEKALDTLLEVMPAPFACSRAFAHTLVHFSFLAETQAVGRDCNIEIYDAPLQACAAFSWGEVALALVKAISVPKYFLQPTPLHHVVHAALYGDINRDFTPLAINEDEVPLPPAVLKGIRQRGNLNKDMVHKADLPYFNKQPVMYRDMAICLDQMLSAFYHAYEYSHETAYQQLHNSPPPHVVVNMDANGNVMSSNIDGMVTNKRASHACVFTAGTLLHSVQALLNANMSATMVTMQPPLHIYHTFLAALFRKRLPTVRSNAKPVWARDSSDIFDLVADDSDGETIVPEKVQHGYDSYGGYKNSQSNQAWGVDDESDGESMHRPTSHHKVAHVDKRSQQAQVSRSKHDMPPLQILETLFRDTEVGRMLAQSTVLADQQLIMAQEQPQVDVLVANAAAVAEDDEYETVTVAGEQIRRKRTSAVLANKINESLKTVGSNSMLMAVRDKSLAASEYWNDLYALSPDPPEPSSLTYALVFDWLYRFQYYDEALALVCRQLLRDRNMALPSEYTIMRAISICKKNKDVGTALWLFEAVHRNNIMFTMRGYAIMASVCADQDSVEGEHMAMRVLEYAKCAHIFNSHPGPSEVLYNNVIRACQSWQAGLKMLADMEAWGVAPNYKSFATLIALAMKDRTGKASAYFTDILMGRINSRRLFSINLEDEMSRGQIGNRLIVEAALRKQITAGGALTAKSATVVAHDLFTAELNALANVGDVAGAVRLLQRAHHAHARAVRLAGGKPTTETEHEPTSYDFAVVMKACAKANPPAISTARKLVHEALVQDKVDNIEFWSSYMQCFEKVKDWAQVLAIFQFLSTGNRLPAFVPLQLNTQFDGKQWRKLRVPHDHPAVSLDSDTMMFSLKNNLTAELTRKAFVHQWEEISKLHNGGLPNSMLMADKLQYNYDEVEGDAIGAVTTTPCLVYSYRSFTRNMTTIDTLERTAFQLIYTHYQDYMYMYYDALRRRNVDLKQLPGFSLLHSTIGNFDSTARLKSQGLHRAELYKRYQDEKKVPSAGDMSIGELHFSEYSFFKRSLLNFARVDKRFLQSGLMSLVNVSPYHTMALLHYMSNIQAIAQRYIKHVTPYLAPIKAKHVMVDETNVELPPNAAMKQEESDYIMPTQQQFMMAKYDYGLIYEALKWVKTVHADETSYTICIGELARTKRYGPAVYIYQDGLAKGYFPTPWRHPGLRIDVTGQQVFFAVAILRYALHSLAEHYHNHLEMPHSDLLVVCGSHRQPDYVLQEALMFAASAFTYPNNPQLVCQPIIDNGVNTGVLRISRAHLVDVIANYTKDGKCLRFIAGYHVAHKAHNGVKTYLDKYITAAIRNTQQIQYDCYGWPIDRDQALADAERTDSAYLQKAKGVHARVSYSPPKLTPADVLAFSQETVTGAEWLSPQSATWWGEDLLFSTRFVEAEWKPKKPEGKETASDSDVGANVSGSAGAHARVGTGAGTRPSNKSGSGHGGKNNAVGIASVKTTASATGKTTAKVEVKKDDASPLKSRASMWGKK